MNIQITHNNDSNSPYINRSPTFVNEQRRSKISEEMFDQMTPLPLALPLNKLLRESHYYLRGATRRASNFPKHRENRCNEHRAISKELRHGIENPITRSTQPGRRAEMVLGVIRQF
jgi:hypothetical protein